MLLYHGSTTDKIQSFAKSKPPVFFTTRQDVAAAYARNQVIGTGTHTGEMNPAIYICDVPHEVFDMRKDEHRALYAVLRSEFLRTNVNANAFHPMIPPLNKSEGFIMSSGLPAFPFAGIARHLLRETPWTAVAVDEGTQGTSIAVLRDLAAITLLEKRRLV